MKYALLIYPPNDGSASAPESADVSAEYFALIDDPHYVTGAQLQPAETATGVRVPAGKTLITDGPFAETKEILGGFMLIEAANLDEATEFAARIPAARMGGGVEIRPCVPR